MGRRRRGKVVAVLGKGGKVSFHDVSFSFSDPEWKHRETTPHGLRHIVFLSKGIRIVSRVATPPSPKVPTGSLLATFTSLAYGVPNSLPYVWILRGYMVEYYKDMECRATGRVALSSASYLFCTNFAVFVSLTFTFIFVKASYNP
jgi:hypothetical protein